MAVATTSELTPLELRRLKALEARLLADGLYTDAGTSPVWYLERVAANTITATYRDTATAQQKTQTNGIISGWDWSQAADELANPNVAALAMAEAKAAANMAKAANLPYYATTTTTGSDGRFTLALPSGLFAADTPVVVLATVLTSQNTTRPHTVNLLSVSPTQVTGYVSYIRPLPGGLLTNLLAALLNYDTVVPAAGCVVHLRAGFPKLTQ